MKARSCVSMMAVLAVGASAMAACGTDESSGAATIPTPDGGGTLPPEGGSPPNDSGTTPVNEASAQPDVTVRPTPAVTPFATTRIANSINPYGLLFASDGLLYASGATMDEGVRKLAVWRFKDGVLDTAFGNGGAVVTDIAGDETSYGIVEPTPGTFVVHAIANGKVFLVKVAKDAGGAYAFATPTFVKFGWDEDEGWPAEMANVPATPPSMNASWGVALDKTSAATPKIVVFASGAPAKAAAGTQRVDNDRWITRVLADSFAIDPGFNGGKPFTMDGDGKNLGDNARRGVVLADGSIVAAGYTDYGQGLGAHIVLIRLLANGTVDPAFGFGTTAPGVPGQTKVNPFLAASGAAEAYSLAVQSSGRIVTTGYGSTNFTTTSKAVDLVTTGILAGGLDTSYGKLGAFAIQSELDKSAGLGTTPFEDRGRDVVCLADDRCVHAGNYDGQAALYVLDKNGKLDVATAPEGRLEYSYPAAFFRIVVSPDGKQVAATAQSLAATTGAPLGSILAVLKVGP